MVVLNALLVPSQAVFTLLPNVSLSLCWARDISWTPEINRGIAAPMASPGPHPPGHWSGKVSCESIKQLKKLMGLRVVLALAVV